MAAGLTTPNYGSASSSWLQAGGYRPNGRAPKPVKPPKAKTPKQPKTPKIPSVAASTGAVIATPPAATPATPFNWGNAYVGNAQYQSTAPSLAAGQNQIGESYGLTMRRDTNKTSPTYGQPIYRLPTEKAGEGTIVASMGPKGEFVWKDAAGNAVDVKDLKVDYVPLVAGQSGYLQGALGNAAAQSENNQQTIAQQAALAGVGRSGMRAQGALAETGNAQGNQARLTQGAMGEYATNLGKWADLYKSIYGELIPNAGSIAPPPEAPVVPPVVPPAPAAPNTNPTTTQGLATGQRLSGGPKGQFMGQVGAILAIKEMSAKDRIQQLKAFAREYALTPEQKKYVALQIKKLGGK